MAMLEELRAKISPQVRANEPMSKHTTYRIGGPAEFYFESNSAEETAKAVAAAKEFGLELFVFGGGSNMLVSDDGIKGLVIRTVANGFKIEGNKVTADAGIPVGFLAMRAVEAGLGGFEWAVGLPGTLGGAVRGNAGMFDGEIKDVIESIRVLWYGQDMNLVNAQCQFAYRDSVIKHHPRGSVIILSATLALQPNAKVAELKAKIKENLAVKRAKQPMDFACAGCVFANWKPENPEDLETLRRSLDLNKEETIPVTSAGAVPAGWIIDRAQLKGVKMGHAMVSDKHANFFVHDGQATANDMISLMAMVKSKIRVITHGIVSLVEEIDYVGF